ncbi:MAG: AMP-binding protein [Gammaproteobacteria bacterium]
MTSVPKGTQLITFTSGTTGQPKGVCLSLALINAVTQSLVETLELETIETHLCLMPLAILLENIAGVFVPLLAGKTVIVKPISTLGLGGSSHLHPGRFSQTLQRLKPDSLILTPALLNAVMQHALSTPQAHIPRYMALGGGVTSNRLLTQAQQLKLPVYQGYGLSECGSVVTVNTPQHNKIGTVGRALPGRAISLAADGEILIDSDHFLGYLSDTESAPSRITSEDGHEQLPTGDLGEIDDAGFLTLKGRKKSQYITAFGRNVSPEWIEAELTSLPHIAQACLAGDGEATLSALIVPTPGSRATDVQRAIDALNSTLPDYARIHHWTPAQAFSVQNDQLTFSGRLKRQTILHDYDNALSRLYAR